MYGVAAAVSQNQKGKMKRQKHTKTPLKCDAFQGTSAQSLKSRFSQAFNSRKDQLRGK